MNYEKGDLVLVVIDNTTSTCVILTSEYTPSSHEATEFYYTYCLETGEYAFTYRYEIASLVSKGFAPDLEIPNQIFETDWSFYDYLFEAFSYFPQFFPDESDSSEDD